jgi:hypothetical protein
MFATSMAGSMRIAAPCVSVSPGLHAAQVHVGLVGPRHHAVQAAQRLVGHHVDLRADRPDEPGLGAEAVAHLLGLRRPRGRAERVLELDLVERVVAAHQHQHRPAVLDDHRQRLDQRPGRHAEHRGHRVDRGRAGRLDRLGTGQRLRQALHGLRRGARDLHVGGVAGVRQGHVVLTRRAGRHVLVSAGAAHHPDVALDPVPLEPGAIEDRVVGLDEERVGLVEALEVAVERVRVLHDELAGAQHPGARARLVALLDLEVVEQLGQVAVGADLARCVRGDDLLVGHRQDQLGVAPVAQLEQLVDLVAAGLLPQLGGLKDRHQQLRAADRVELLAHDLLGPAVGAPARRQPGPQARPELACEPRPHQQPVRGRLGLGGVLAGGRQEVAGQAGHGGRLYPRKAQHPHRKADQ